MANKLAFTRQLLALLAVYSNEFSKGVFEGWSSMVNFKLKKYSTETQLPFTIEQYNFEFSTLKGYVVGSIASAVLLDKIGRKYLLIYSTVLKIFPWLLILSTDSTYLLQTAYFITAVSTGISDTTSAIYIGEITAPKNRIIFGYLSRAFYITGNFFGNFVVQMYNYPSAALILFKTEFVSFLSLILFVTDTPDYLIMNGSLERAKTIFTWLNGISTRETHEFFMLKNNVYHELYIQKSFYRTYSTPANFKSLSLLLMLTILSESLGYNIVKFLENDILNLGPLHALFSFLFSFRKHLFLFTELIGIMFSILMIRYAVGSKIILQISCYTAYLIQLFLTLMIFIGLDSNNSIFNAICAFIIFSLYFCSCSVVFVEMFLARSELLPLSIKPFGNCVIVLCSYILRFWFTPLLYKCIKAELGLSGNFFFFFISGFIMTLVVEFWLPERENKSLQEIQGIWSEQNWI